jgi:RNA-directed DNA polymerase
MNYTEAKLRIKDKGLLHLVDKGLRAGVAVNGRVCRTVRGVPRGGPLSPLLSNILLDDFDKELERGKDRTRMRGGVVRDG